jgi:hypothetical protein
MSLFSVGTPNSQTKPEVDIILVPYFYYFIVFGFGNDAYINITTATESNVFFYIYFIECECIEWIELKLN